MSHNIYLLPAHELDALYEVKTHTLKLFAKGCSEPVTDEIEFRRVEDMCGLKFQLQGRVLRVMGPQQAYCKDQSFKMPPPRTDTVFIIYEGDRHGKPIPIRFTGFLGSEEISPKSAGLSPPGPLRHLIAENENIHVLSGGTFTIKETSEVPRRGSIHIQFDKKYLDLQTAGIQDKDIFWTFKALQPTPDTQVSLFVAGVDYVYDKVYDVKIDLASHDTFQLTSEGEVLPFIRRVEEGIRKIRDGGYPDATLHKVDADPPVPSIVDNPIFCQSLTVACRVDQNRIATVFTHGIGPFSQIEIAKIKLDDLKEIKWPIKMDPEQADKLMKKAGWKTGYYRFDVTFFGTGEEPHYTFHLAYNPQGVAEVHVGVITGSVTPPSPDSDIDDDAQKH